MFRVYTAIIRNIRCWVAAYGFLHRVLGWMVVLRAAVCTVRMVPCARHHPHHKHDLRSGSQDHHPYKNSVQKTICCNSSICSWWWPYVPETCRAKNISIEFTSCIKLAFHFISSICCPAGNRQTFVRSLTRQPSVNTEVPQLRETISGQTHGTRWGTWKEADWAGTLKDE